MATCSASIDGCTEEAHQACFVSLAHPRPPRSQRYRKNRWDAGVTAGPGAEALLCRCRVAVLTQRLVAALHADCRHSMPPGPALQLIGVLQV